MSSEHEQINLLLLDNIQHYFRDRTPLQDFLVVHMSEKVRRNNFLKIELCFGEITVRTHRQRIERYGKMRFGRHSVHYEKLSVIQFCDRGRRLQRTLRGVRKVR